MGIQSAPRLHRAFFMELEQRLENSAEADLITIARAIASRLGALTEGYEQSAKIIGAPFQSGMEFAWVYEDGRCIIVASLFTRALNIYDKQTQNPCLCLRGDGTLVRKHDDFKALRAHFTDLIILSLEES